MHQLIEAESTGCPEQFALQLHLSLRQLNNEQERLKEIDSPVKYCRKRSSFYYVEPFKLDLHYSLKTIRGEEVRNFFGGSYLHDCAMQPHRSLINLP
jgi:hypothetical protein